MYKIKAHTDAIGMPNKKYTISAYVFDKRTHYNQEVWTASNIDEDMLATILQLDGSERLDTSEAFVILNSGNGPVILTDNGTLLAVPVKKDVVIKGCSNAKHVTSKEKASKAVKDRSQPAFQRKRSTKVSNEKRRND